jgi:Transglutaminase-like superfamily
VINVAINNSPIRIQTDISTLAATSIRRLIVQIGVGYKITYNLPQPTPMLLTVNIHYSRTSDLVVPDHLVTVPAVPVTGYRDLFGNWISRIVAPSGQIHLSATPSSKTPASPIRFTRMQSNTPCTTCRKKVCFSSSAAGIVRRTTYQKSPGTSSLVVLLDGGVCRQSATSFMNASNSATNMAARPKLPGRRIRKALECAATSLTWQSPLCRCMNIPARYCTGYLGDIGVPAMDAPMGFSGWFEAYLGGQWHVFDARFNTPRVGRVLMARGRDAADVAIVTTFGPNTLTGFEVTANEIVP